MNPQDLTSPPPQRGTSELRVGLVCAALMLAIPLAVKMAARFGWTDTADLANRALTTILAGFIVLTGNTIPKRLSGLCVNADEASVQSFRRFAGWTWVLTGLAFGLVCLLLPRAASTTATLLIVPAGMALVAVRWIRLYTARRPT